MLFSVFFSHLRALAPQFFILRGSFSVLSKGYWIFHFFSMAINNLVHFNGKTMLPERYSLKLFVKENECGVILMGGVNW